MGTLLNRRRYMVGGEAPVKNYLKFTAIEDGTFQYTKALEYSIDNGKTWVSLAASTATPTITSGNSILLKGTYTPATSGTNAFSATGNFNASGNPKSVWAGDNFETATLPNGAFYRMFKNNTKIVDASELDMSFSTATTECCYEMFYGCSSLVSAPQLPATTVAPQTYAQMFNGCRALTSATTVLPATTTYRSCYEQMFRNCSELTTAPVLPALSLAQMCYFYMFAGCSKLNYIKAMFTTIGSNSINQWVQGVSSSGTFVKNTNATWTNTGASGVPTGWTIEYETP